MPRNLCGPCVAAVVNAAPINIAIRTNGAPDWYFSNNSAVAEELEALALQLNTGEPRRGAWINLPSGEVYRMVAVTEVNHVPYCAIHAARCGHRL